MGGITNKVRGDEPPIPGAPLIRIKARGMWGGVTVRNPSRRGTLRRARQQLRDEMRAGRHQMRHDLRHGRDEVRRELRDRRRSGRDPAQLAEEALDIARRAIDRALPPPSSHDRIPPMPDQQGEPQPAARTERETSPDGEAAANAAQAAANAAQSAPAAPAPPATPPTPPTPAAPTPPTPPTPPAPAAAPGSGEDVLPKIPTGTLTIMVSDIVGSTQMAERLGDQSWLDVLQEHNAIVRQHVSDHGGTEVKAQGDGFLVVFPSARSAVLAAIAIQREMIRYDHDHLDGDPVAVRVGLHTGEVVAVDGDVFGQNVVVASRIAAVADPGDIFVSGLTHDLTSSSSDLGFEPGKEVDLKGMSAPWRVHRVIWS
jgi:class 3 adenylate cyclase